MHYREHLQRFAVAAVMVAASPALGQELCASIDCKQLARTVLDDTSVPTSPAFTVLNVTGDTAVRPRSPDEFATQILNNVDQHGNFQSGLAIDFSPARVFYAKDLTLEKYNTDQWWRTFANTQVSIATTKGQESEDKSTRLALGLHITPWISEDDDPRRQGWHIDCITSASKTALALARKRVDNQVIAKKITDRKVVQALRDEISREELARETKQCHDDWKEKRKSVSALTIGVTPTWTSEDSDLDDLDASGVALWSSLALGLDGFDKLPLVGGEGEAIFHIRYRGDEVVANPVGDGTFLDQDTFMASFQMRFESSEDSANDMLNDVRYSLEAAYVNADRSDRIDDEYYVWSGKAEFRVPSMGDNLWFNLTAGTSTGRAEDEETFGGLSINWAYNDKTAK